MNGGNNGLANNRIGRLVEKRMAIVLFLGVAWICGVAQPQPSEIPSGTAATSQIVLPAGTLVTLRTTRRLTSKDTKPGDLLELEVAREVKVGDLLVIARKKRATASVVEAQHARRAMRGGRVGLELRTVDTITGEAIPLRAMKSARGGPTTTEKANAVIEGAFILSWLPFVFKGDEASLPKGTPMEAYVDRDVTLDAARVAERMAALEAQDAAARTAARTGDATVHLYHDRQGLTQEILLEGHRLVRLRPSRFFTLRLPPGTHTVGCQKSELSLNLKPDEEYYVRMVWELHFLSWHCIPTLTPTEQGEDQIYPLTAADPKDVFLH
jgi:hypothetical protein